jgi:hypothetical protein
VTSAELLEKAMDCNFFTRDKNCQLNLLEIVMDLVGFDGITYVNMLGDSIQPQPSGRNP